MEICRAVINLINIEQKISGTLHEDVSVFFLSGGIILSYSIAVQN